MLDHGERVTRQALQALPHGSWTAEDCLDDDGVSDDLIPMKVTVTIDADGCASTSPARRARCGGR